MNEITVLCGSALDQLKTLPDGVVQTVVTSPPYWGLRDYGTASWDGGDPDCDHRTSNPGNKVFGNTSPAIVRPCRELTKTADYQFRDVCEKCGAVRVDHQVGLEKTPQEYVDHLVEIFREIRRVLRDDGTVWLNLGDSYAGKGYYGEQDFGGKGDEHGQKWHVKQPNPSDMGLKPKDMVGIPWRVAFGLQADGWFLRSDIVWCKGNAMPESVRDRPTKAHEYIFLLAKSQHYFYDSDAIMEPARDDSARWGGNQKYENQEMGAQGLGEYEYNGYRNKRTYWIVNTQPFPEAHFAVYPQELIEPCILAGSSDRCCPTCLKPWKRVKEESFTKHDGNTESTYDDKSTAGRLALLRQAARERGAEYQNLPKTIKWEPGCDCPDNDGTGKSVVLDPFSGSGTTGIVAIKNRRKFVGVELNPEYCEMISKRLGEVQVRLF